MRSQLSISVCSLALALVACTAKERDKNLSNGGSAGQGAEGGSAGSSGSGTGADGGSSGAGEGGAGAVGGNAGAGAMGGASGGVGGSGGAGGSGGGTLSCQVGNAYRLDDPGQTLPDEPDVAVTQCGEKTYVIHQTEEGLAIHGIGLSLDPGGIDTYTYRDQGARVFGAECDANELRVLSANGNGLGVLKFARSSAGLQSPLAPSLTPISTPQPCFDALNGVEASYTGGLHFAMRCRAADDVIHMYVGTPSQVQEFASGTDDKQLELGAYAFSGGLHVAMNEQGEGWVGATPADMTLRKLSFEDPVARPTAFGGISSSSNGFIVMGVTTNPPPSLLPAKVFTGVVPPSQISGIFVGGSLPSTVTAQVTITTTDGLGPTSRISVGTNSMVQSGITAQGAMRFNIFDSQAKVLLWWQDIYTPPAGSRARRAYASHDDFAASMAAWAEYDANGVYSVKGVNLMCF